MPVQVVQVPAESGGPLLVTATVCLGAKALVASALMRFDTLAEDLVACCLDDLASRGARPLAITFVLTGEAETIVERALRESVERAWPGSTFVVGPLESPDVVSRRGTGAFDLVATSTGVVAADDVIDGLAVRPGDAILGLAATALSADASFALFEALTRRGVDWAAGCEGTLAEVLGSVSPDDADDESEDLSLGQALLAPRRSQAAAVLEAQAALRRRAHRLNGAGRISGTLRHDLPAILPNGLGARVVPDAWPVPVTMRLLAALMELDGAALRSRYDCGIGQVLVLPPAGVARLGDHLWQEHVPNWVVGEVASTEDLGGGRYVEVALGH